ncbi:hypothetical protein MKX01_026979 [Papaver californicum]|nr:hypothetical protein MKX01_026979 [Papaver californicum]
MVKICCIGAGYVGGPTMAMIAYKCPDIQVVVVDISVPRINAWNSDRLPIFEPGLDDVVKSCRNTNLFFSTDVESHIADSDIIFAADLTYWESAARMIADVAKTDKIVVEKSTVPVKTAEAIEKILNHNSRDGVNFQILSNTEFLAEGTAIDDLTNGSGQKAVAVLKDVYAKWVSEDRIITTNLWSAELSKLAANAILAQRISSINAMSALCEATGANVSEVAYAVGKDTWIGPKFLSASVANYWRQVVQINDYQKLRFVNRVVSSMFNTVSGKKILSTPAIDVCLGLLGDKAKLSMYDPQVCEDQIRRDLATNKFDWDHPQHLVPSSPTVKSKETVTVTWDAYEAAKGAHGICIVTEWDEFKSLDYQRIYDGMEKPAFVSDGRNVVNPDKLRNIGFIVYSIGKPLDAWMKDLPAAPLS